MKKKSNSTLFPWGVFLALLVILALLSAATTAVYTFVSIKSGIAGIEYNARQYSTRLTEASASLAELCYGIRDYRRLESLFRQSVGENGVLEAFFVTPDGRILAHSSRETAESLKGNIASDEFSYNTDQILLPLHQKEAEVLFVDYNIFSQRVPFNREERRLIKMHLYPAISTVGWLSTQAVRHRGKPVGTVNFLISKKPVYDLLKKQFDFALRAASVLGPLSFAIAFIIAIMVYLRLRRFRRERTAVESAGPVDIAAAQSVVKETRTGAERVYNAKNEILDAIPLTR